MRKWGIVCMSVGGAAIGLLQAKDFLPAALGRYLSPNALHTYTLVALIVVLLGAAVTILGFGAQTVSGIVVPRRFSCSLARTSDVSEIHAFALALLGSGISGINQMKAWLRKCDRSILLVHAEKRVGTRRDRTLVGYFCLLPLIDTAAMALESGALKGNQLQDDHLSKDRCRVLYLGGIAARGQMGKGVAVGALQQELERIRRHQAAEVVYTRPINKDGLQLAKTYGFSALSGGHPRIGELAHATLSDILD